MKTGSPLFDKINTQSRHRKYEVLDTAEFQNYYAGVAEKLKQVEQQLKEAAKAQAKTEGKDKPEAKEAPELVLGAEDLKAFLAQILVAEGFGEQAAIAIAQAVDPSSPQAAAQFAAAVQALCNLKGSKHINVALWEFNRVLVGQAQAQQPARTGRAGKRRGGSTPGPNGAAQRKQGATQTQGTTSGTNKYTAEQNNEYFWQHADKELPAAFNEYNLTGKMHEKIVKWCEQKPAADKQKCDAYALKSHVNFTTLGAELAGNENQISIEDHVKRYDLQKEEIKAHLDSGKFERNAKTEEYIRQTTSAQKIVLKEISQRSRNVMNASGFKTADMEKELNPAPANPPLTPASTPTASPSPKQTSSPVAQQQQDQTKELKAFKSLLALTPEVPNDQSQAAAPSPTPAKKGKASRKNNLRK